MKSCLPKLDGVAGAAFLLRAPARQTLTIHRAEGVVEVREGAPYVTVQLFTPVDSDTHRTTAWRVVQEAFDIHAATHREAFATQAGWSEYLMWGRRNDGVHLTITTTMRAGWSISGHGHAPGPARPAPPPTPHHPSFRYYRLSQLSDDLFDAYRNAFLALECLVSDTSPKAPQEREVDWLKRVLGGPLAGGLPGGMDVNATVEALYKHGRLPLFHAKADQTYYSPQGEDRARVQPLFHTLSHILAALYRYRFGVGGGGWGRLSDTAKDASLRAGFQFDEVVCLAADGRERVGSRVEVIENPRRLNNLWARVELQPPVTLASINAFELLRGGEPCAWEELKESVPLEGVVAMILEVQAVSRNVREPNPDHPA